MIKIIHDTDTLKMLLDEPSGSQNEVILIDSHQSNKPLLMPSCMEVPIVSSHGGNSCTTDMNPVSTGHHVIADSFNQTGLTTANSYESSSRYLPRYIFGSYSSRSSHEGALQPPVRCHLVTDTSEQEGITELVLMDTGIQSSADTVSHSFEDQCDACEDDHVIEEI
jgi:hypothetical protein